MTVEICPVTSPDRDRRGFEVVVVAARAEVEALDPGDPLPGEREVAAYYLGGPPDRKRMLLAARLDGEPAGIASASTMSRPGDELQVVELDVTVLPELRRRGVATSLVAESLPILNGWGQTSVVGYPCAGLWADAGSGFCQRYGMEKRQEERCSRAEVGDIEDELMSTWIADAATKAAGYRLEQWVGPCPEHLLPHWCAALAGMEDAPLDDIDYNPFTRDLDQQRQAEQSYLARGYRSYSTLALSPDGEAAGMSEIKLHPDRPQIGRQGDTAVLAAHRGHGIGRWMKAANYRLVREAHPELRVIETYNAQSNPWMLDINIAMGYRPHHVFHACQAPIETVLAAVAART